MTNKKTVMTQAWTIARTAKAKFGGKVREYISSALKVAWASIKAPIFAAVKPALAGLNLARQENRIEDAVIRTEAHSGWSKGWMARITLAASRAHFDLDRSFVNGDKSGVNRSGNGTIEYNTKFLADGIYETDSVLKSYTSHRSYFRIAAGAVVELFANKNEAKAALV